MALPATTLCSSNNNLFKIRTNRPKSRSESAASRGGGGCYFGVNDEILALPPDGQSFEYALIFIWHVGHVFLFTKSTLLQKWKRALKLQN